MQPPLATTPLGASAYILTGAMWGWTTQQTKIIDALDILSDGRILISTIGDFSVPGLTGKDEDLLAFTPSTLGDTTSGSWAMYFDGSLTALGLGNSAEDIDALELASNGDIYLSTGDVFAVTNISGEDEDIFVCTPTYTSGAVTSCTYSSTLFFDGSTYGLSANDVDAINLPLSLALNSSTLALSASQSKRLPSYQDPVQSNAHFASYKFEPPQQGGSQTFTATADAYVAGDATTTNYGTATTLRADNSPDLNSYLRFDIQGLTGSITSATLRIYANSTSSTGYTVHAVTDNTWTETGITYSNAPAIGSQLGSSGSFSIAGWTTVDVTSYITGNGVYNLAFSTTSNTNISFSSREGTNAPQLVIETSTGGPTNTPTATPSPTTTATAGPSPTPTRTPTPGLTNTATVIPTTPPPSFQSAEFDYDGDGKRVKSTINGTITTYFVGAHYEVSGSTIIKYYYAGAQRIAMRSNGTLNYLLGDHLGSTSLTTDAAGNKVSEVRYKAWGEVRYAWGNVPTKYQYTGQFSYESDFGLYFYNARWYDSSLSRFTQADSVLANPVWGWDRYAYVNNNPLVYTDPSGHRPCGDGEAVNCDGTTNTTTPPIDLGASSDPDNPDAIDLTGRSDRVQNLYDLYRTMWYAPKDSWWWKRYGSGGFTIWEFMSIFLGYEQSLYPSSQHFATSLSNKAPVWCLYMGCNPHSAEGALEFIASYSQSARRRANCLEENTCKAAFNAPPIPSAGDSMDIVEAIQSGGPGFPGGNELYDVGNISMRPKIFKKMIALGMVNTVWGQKGQDRMIILTFCQAQMASYAVYNGGAGAINMRTYSNFCGG